MAWPVHNCRTLRHNLHFEKCTWQETKDKNQPQSTEALPPGLSVRQQACQSNNELTSQSEPDEPSDNESENETKADPAEDDLPDNELNQSADPAEDELPDSEPNQPDPRCKCKTRCSTRKCPCRGQEHACGHLCHPGRTCANTCNADEPKELIDLTKAELQAQPSDNLWIAVGETKLSVEDRNVLESQGWLSDKHIHAAQQLLKKQHPQVAGLQNTILQCMSTWEATTG